MADLGWMIASALNIDICFRSIATFRALVTITRTPLSVSATYSNATTPNDHTNDHRYPSSCNISLSAKAMDTYKALTWKDRLATAASPVGIRENSRAEMRVPSR